MKIVVSTLSYTHFPYMSFLYELAGDWAREHTGDTVYILIKKEGKEQNRSEASDVPNVRVIEVEPPTFFTGSYNYKIKKELKKIEPDRVLSILPLKDMDGTDYLWIASPLEQLMEGEESDRKNIEKGIASGGTILVFSEAEKQWLVNTIKVDVSRIRVVYGYPQARDTVLTFEEKTMVKEEYTDGNEFFLCKPVNDGEMLREILKGFSRFKSWQKSHMKMVLIDEGEKGVNLSGLLANYRLHNDVVVVKKSDGNNLGKLIGAAYAVLIPGKHAPSASFMYHAFSLEVPVITPDGSACTDVVGNAVLTYNDNVKEDLTRVMLNVFRDEKERSNYIKKGKEVLEQYDRTAHFHPFQ